MMGPLLLGVYLALSGQKLKLGPSLPSGVDREFAAAMVRVEERLQASDFSGAAKACTLLPSHEIVIQWDDSHVPSGLLGQFASERDRALDIWRKITKANISVGNVGAAVSFSFETSLPDPPGVGLPAGATFGWSSDDSGPRLKVVIALQRGNPLETIDPVNVENEVAHAIGSYLGLATSPFPGTLMGRMELNFHQASGVSALEVAAANQNLAAVDILRAAVRDRLPVIPTEPKLILQQEEIDMGTALQGDPKEFQLQIMNQGNAPLAMHFTPDCGCVVTTREALVQPGERFVLKGQYDTSIRSGDIRHQLVATSNDPDKTIVTIPIHIVVNPRFRLFLPGGQVVKLPKTGASFVAYLLVADGFSLNTTRVYLSGIAGSANIEKWSGTIADPELNDPARPRTGFKVTARLTGEMSEFGRTAGALVIETDDKRFPTLVADFYAQRGIVALPNQLFLGEMESKPAYYSILLSGPAGKFHVKRVTSDWVHLKFNVFPNSDGSQFRIQANYDGSGQKGPVKGTMKVETDDPEQPTIAVPIIGTVAASPGAQP